MDEDTRRIAALLQAAARCINRHLDALWNSSRLHDAARGAKREPASAGDAALPLQGQRSRVANRQGVGYLLPRRELTEVEMCRVHV